MNIILFTNKRGQVWNFELNLLHFGVTAVAALVVLLLYGHTDRRK